MNYSDSTALHYKSPIISATVTCAIHYCSTTILVKLITRALQHFSLVDDDTDYHARRTCYRPLLYVRLTGAAWTMLSACPGSDRLRSAYCMHSPTGSRFHFLWKSKHCSKLANLILIYSPYFATVRGGEKNNNSAFSKT